MGQPKHTPSTYAADDSLRRALHTVDPQSYDTSTAFTATSFSNLIDCGLKRIQKT